jgi:hypothetical protein
MASQISKIGKIKTEEGVEGGMSRRPDSFGKMRGGLFFWNTFDFLCWLYPSCLIVDIYRCW